MIHRQTKRCLRISQLLLLAVAIAFIAYYYYYYHSNSAYHHDDERNFHHRVQRLPEIPHRIHQIFKDEHIIDAYAQYMTTWVQKQPGYEYYFWSDADIKLLVEQEFPQLLDTFNSYKHDLQRADSARYMILYSLGGVYADADYTSLKSLDPFLIDKTCILTPEPKEQSLLIYNKSRLITNSFIACTPKHPFLKILIENLPQALKSHKIKKGDPYGMDILQTTGPQFLQRQLDSYAVQNESGRVYITPYELLSPTTDFEKGNFFRNVCEKDKAKLGSDQRAACERMGENNWRVDDTSQAYAMHHWTHYGYRYKNSEKAKMKKIHINDLMVNSSVHRYGGTIVPTRLTENIP